MVMTRSYLATSVQCAGLSCLFGLLTVLPPAQGAMLLQPLGPGPIHGIAAIAIASGAVPLGRAANGALVVRGDRDRLATALLPHAVIPLAAPERICGSIVKGRS